MSTISLTTKAMLYLVEPIIKEIIADIIKSTVTSENLKGIKDKMYQGLVYITGKTSFTIDDTIVLSAFNAITNPDLYAEGGDALLDAVEAWVAASETKWDDMALLPAINAIREAVNIPDGND